MIKKNVLKVGSGFVVGLIINYFFYSSGFLMQTIVCSFAVLVLYEGIDRLTGTLQKWDQEYNAVFKFTRGAVKSEVEKLTRYRNKYGVDMSRALEDIKNEK